MIAYHLRQSFRPGEISPNEANRLGCELAKRFTKENHAFIVCTHIDKAHVHNHIIWAATTLDETKKFRDFKRSAQAVRRLNDTICIQNGYSIVENPKGKGKSYDKWLGDKKKPSHRERICFAIDDALAKKPMDFEALLELLRQAGYEIKHGKVPSLRGAEQKNYIRMDTLGDGYSPNEIRAIIAGAKAHTPRKRFVQDAPEKPSGSLLIDIQAKLAEGKGAGYAKWATSYNLKQMSKTMIYLQENGLLDLNVLNQQTSKATQLFNELSRKQKEIEKRMAEISILQKHINDYYDTREVYVGYRKAGYSKKYHAEHESDILLHQAAKKYFDEIKLEHIPSRKSLHSEFNELLLQKRSIFSEYKKAQAKMRELQTAKANVDRVLNMDTTKLSKEKEETQR